MAVTAEYTVRLGQVFQGPMDLLLHLVREQEVDIHEVELGAVCDGFLAYLKQLESLDVEVAADFLVLAATLMSIKARSLLPTEEVDLEAELDPRDELIQRLIEYRRFKGAAGELDERLAARNRIARHGFKHRSEEEPTLDLSELSKWDLLSTFSRLMRETLADRAMRIESDERPMRWYVGRLVSWVKQRESLTLRELLATAADESPSKAMLIGTFCALLELMKLGVVTAHAPDRGSDPEADVRIALKPEHRDDIEEIVRTSGFEDETPDAPEASDPTAALQPDGGRPATPGPHSPPPQDDLGELEAPEDPREAHSGGYGS
jgi:segregation and condensation protein A